MKAIIDHRRSIIDLVTKNGMGVEIGVHLGDFSSIILNIATPEKLYLIDPWKHFKDPDKSDSWYGGDNITQEIMDKRYEGVMKKFERQISSGKVEIYRELSVEAARHFSDAQLDFVYIDGDHSYEGVKNDLAAFFPKVKPGGLIIGDDYTLGAWWKDGVVRAFHEFLVESNTVIHAKLESQIAIRKL